METGRFPNKLLSYRRCIGLTRKRVARVLGHADTSTLSRWERGITLPSLVQVFQLATMYRVMPHELFHDLWLSIERDERLLISSEMITSNSYTSM